MKLIALSCQQCGAPLEVPAELKHVSCAHCGAALVIKKQGSVLFTEKIEALELRASGVESDIKQLRMKLMLDRLKQDWQSRRKELALAWAENYVIAPTYAIGNLMAVLALAMAFIIGNLTETFLGVVIFAGGLMMTTHVYVQAGIYEKARKHYIDERRNIRRRKNQ